jgi:cytochrome oxidase Cu insertion factor (SCO1/SenC/PrrC family)
MTKEKLLWAILVATLLGVPAAFFIQQSQKPKLPHYGMASDFTLTERDGRSVSQKNLRGKIWVADFIFTSCAGQCPMISQQMERLQRQLPSSVTFVSFTVDPERDTPEVLADYSKNYNADSSRWLFLTGDKETLTRVTTSFYMDGIEDPNLHSIRFALVDPYSQIRGYYDASDPQALQKLSSDVAALLRESQ